MNAEATTKRISTVKNEVHTLQNRVQELHTALGQLAHRLAPVLSEPSPDANAAVDPAPRHCELQGELAAVNNDISNLVQYVGIMLDNLQV